MSIGFIGHSHHRVTGSSRFLLDALRTRGTVEERWSDGWRAAAAPDPETLVTRDDEAVVVWQVEEAALALARTRHPNVTFFPMYDSCHAYVDSYWRQLAGIKIVCFSATLHARLARLGLRTRHVQYFPAPPPAKGERPGRGLAGYLWQRNRDVTWAAVRTLLGDAPVERFTLHDAPDPGAGELPAPTPEEVVRYGIRTTRWFSNPAEAHAALAAHDVYFAPRVREGIGMSYLEAMAMGLLVVAPALPTHDEYVVSGVNGLLYDPERPIALDFSRRRALGARARESVERGHERWLRILPAVLDLIEAPPAAVAPGGSWSWVPAERRASRAPARPTRSGSGVTVVLSRGSGGPALDESLRSLSAQDARVDVRIVARRSDVAAVARELGDSELVLLLDPGDRLATNDALSSAVRDAPDGADVLYGDHVARDLAGDEELVRAAELHAACAQIDRGALSSALLAGLPAPGAVLWRAALLRDFPARSDLPRTAHVAHLCRLARGGLRARHTLSVLCSSPRPYESVRERLRLLAEWDVLAREFCGDPERAARALGELRRRVWVWEPHRLRTRELLLASCAFPGAVRELKRRLRAQRLRRAAGCAR